MHELSFYLDAGKKLRESLAEAAHSHMLSADYRSQPCLRLNLTHHRQAIPQPLQIRLLVLLILLCPNKYRMMTVLICSAVRA